MEFSAQYESVIAFGPLTLVPDGLKRHALPSWIGKHFPDLEPGRDFRAITKQELRRTSAYVIEIEEWSGKRNWPERTERYPDWTSDN